MYRCPQCNSEEDLSITSEVTMHFFIDGEGNVDDSDYADGLTWGDDDEASCSHCNWSGTVNDIYIEEYEEEESPS